jgi:hypothetical protein
MADIDELAEIARRLGYQSREQVIIHLERQIARDESYLQRRKNRGTHTPTDDAMANDCAVAALLIKFLKGEVAL